MTSIISSSSIIRHPSSELNGWINLDKPLGISSAQAVAKVKHLLYKLPPEYRAGKKIAIGHAGTLDPLASGILPLAVGEATKTVSYMMDAAKSYSFTVTWGQERTTDDSAGEVVHESGNRPEINDINNILQQFTGNISQIPPNYSAIKLAGKRAYDLARSGQEVDIKPREVIVKSLEIVTPDLLGGLGQQTSSDDLSLDPRSKAGMTHFLCHCGKGTYIRSLARDMGRVLGCYGYVSSLRRVQVGKFNENNAISLENLSDMVHKGMVDFLQPVESALDDILAWDIDSTLAVRLRHGQTVNLPNIDGGDGEGIFMLARYNGKPVAICKRNEGVMKPVRVFNI
ncbi:MAG: tRNA pseudouridine(55) synthase TruB [Rickettsiales bacterium]